jgi:hypothetical protein
MYNLNNNKQLTNNCQHSIGSHGKRQLLFTFSTLNLMFYGLIIKYRDREIKPKKMQGYWGEAGSRELLLFEISF